MWERQTEEEGNEEEKDEEEVDETEEMEEEWKRKTYNGHPLHKARKRGGIVTNDCQRKPP